MTIAELISLLLKMDQSKMVMLPNGGVPGEWVLLRNSEVEQITVKKAEWSDGIFVEGHSINAVSFG